MRRFLFIALFLIGLSATMNAQSRRPSGPDSRGGFSLANIMKASKEVPDSLLNDSTKSHSRIDAFHLTRMIGDRYVAPMDTDRINFYNTMIPDSRSLAIGYLANNGSPAQTKIFSERKEARDFIFADAYDYYITTPENAYFYDTKIPYTLVNYETGGGSTNKEDHLSGVLTMNFGKKLNVGADMDYIYSRGYYDSNGNKMLSYRFFASYHSDHYELNAYASNFNFVSHENGGLTNDLYITNPDNFNDGKRVTDSKSYPVRYDKAYNRVRGKQFFLTHRYNVGFHRELEELDSLGNHKQQFVPVSSLIHTFQYEDNFRRFIENDNIIDTCYTHLYGMDATLNDVTTSWSMKNTIALSLREGFQKWAKFGLTGFVNFDKRRFNLPAMVPGLTYPNQEGVGYPTTLDFPTEDVYDEFSTYVGAELSKKQGSILTYDARGELCVVGDDVGEFRGKGNLQTTFPLFGKPAIISAGAIIDNVTPAFYLRHNHSRYFWWDQSLDKIQHFTVEGSVELKSTGTKFSANVTSIQNYVYIGTDGTPKQYGSNLQVITGRIKQDFHVRAFNWENEAAYQVSSDQNIIPLPDLSIYSNMYLKFRLAKVLMVQLGADVRWNTSYYAPYYEPATQQFQNQEELKVGGYPLMNAYINFHLKQARFFIMAYNLSQKFADPKYFSLPHYPLNSMIVKMGISVMFNN